MEAPGDVRLFDRLAPLYDLLTPAADAAALEAGLALAGCDVRRLLDVGGGTGRAARALDAPERVVVDASARMLRRARSRGLGVVQGDGAHLPVRDASVDAVLVVDALHHVADPDAAVREAARVLRPGGVLVLREFDPTTLRGRALAAAEHLVGLDSRFFAPDDLAGRVAAAGLDPAVPDRGFEYTVAGVKR